MQRYVLFLLISNVLSVTFSETLMKQNVNNLTLAAIGDRKLESRRKLPLFPKNTLKFVVTPLPYIEKAFTHRPKERIMTKLPLLPQITARPTTIPTKRLVTRKPLMELRTFTIHSLTNGKLQPIEDLKPDTVIKEAESFKTSDASKLSTDNTKPTIDLTKDFYVSEESSKKHFLEPITKYRSVLNSTKEIKQERIAHASNLINFTVKPTINTSTDFYIPEENTIIMKKHIIQSDTKDKSVPDINEQIKQKHTIGNKDYSSIEEEDDNEFIFLEYEDNKYIVNDMLGSADQNSVEVYDITTELNVIERKKRVKRSKNIIEEENLASTVSSFKYTGRDTRLNNEVYFKNINV